MNTNNEVWIWIEQRNGRLMNVSLQALNKGLELSKKLSGKLVAVLIGDKTETLADKLVNYGAEKVYQVSDSKLKNFKSNAYTRIISKLIKKHMPEILLFGATSIGMQLAPAVAARVDTGLTAHCSDLFIEEIDNKPQLITTVPGFNGGMIVEIICPEKRPQMATISSGITEMPKEDSNRQGEIIKIDYKEEEEDKYTKTIEMVEKQPSYKPVEGAPIVVAGGRGMKSGEGVKLVKELAEVIGAAKGGTRPAVDAGWVPQENMIGSSGKIISPDLLISVGASGAAHFSSGFLKSKFIIAIDKDPQAPIFDICDIGIVADINKFVPNLIEELKVAK